MTILDCKGKGIVCRTELEYNICLNILYSTGYEWAGGNGIIPSFFCDVYDEDDDSYSSGLIVVFVERDMTITYSRDYEWSIVNEEIVEFRELTN